MPAGTLSGEVTRTTLAVILIGVLIASCFWIMKPFLYAIIWAAMIVIATWPLLISLQSLLGGRRWAAVVIMTLLLLGILFLPLTVAVMMLVDKAQELFITGKASFWSIQIPAAPDWVHKIPLAGPKIVSFWNEYGSLDTSKIAEHISPYYEKILGWVVNQAESLGMIIVNSMVTIVIAAVLYANGEAAAEGICRFAGRIAGEQGENAVILAAKAVRGVALGIVVTAVAQSLMTYGGLVIAGVPGAVLLTAIAFIVCIAQIGPTVVLIPVIIWLFYNGQPGWGWFMIVWTAVAATIDNFIRPVMIKKGADLPLLLIFAGVLGGLISFGILGLFIGPVMLAVTYTLVREWVAAGEAAEQ
jgi:predicted PurR-regulated permease PerM